MRPLFLFGCWRGKQDGPMIREAGGRMGACSGACEPEWMWGQGTRSPEPAIQPQDLDSRLPPHVATRVVRLGRGGGEGGLPYEQSSAMHCHRQCPANAAQQLRLADPCIHAWVEGHPQVVRILQYEPTKQASLQQQQVCATYLRVTVGNYRIMPETAITTLDPARKVECAASFRKRGVVVLPYMPC